MGGYSTKLLFLEEQILRPSPQSSPHEGEEDRFEKYEKLECRCRRPKLEIGVVNSIARGRPGHFNNRFLFAWSLALDFAILAAVAIL